MAKNRKGEEIGGQTYYLFALEFLRRNGGSTTGEQLEAAVKAAFGSRWGPEDTRVVKGNRRKWQAERGVF